MPVATPPARIDCQRITMPNGSFNCPLPEPREPNCDRQAPLLLNSSTRLLPLSTTQILSPESIPIPLGPLSCPLPEPGEPNCDRQAPLLLNSSTRLLPQSATQILPQESLPIPLGQFTVHCRNRLSQTGKAGAAAAEFFHPVVARVCHPYVATDADCDREWTVELSIAGTQGAKLRQVGAAAAAKLFHPVVAVIHHPKIATGINKEPRRTIELSIAGTQGAKLRQVGAAAAEFFHPVVAHVGHQILPPESIATPAGLNRFPLPEPPEPNWET